MLRILPPITRELPDCAVFHVTGLADSAVGEFVEELRMAGVAVETEGRAPENEIYAALEWLLPTAVAVYIADKYFGTLIQETAKLHFPVIRAALKKFVRRLLVGPDALFLIRVASPPQKISRSEPCVLSVYARLNDGRRLKFLLESSRAPEEAVDRMLEFLQLQASFDGLSESEVRCQLPVARQIVLQYDPAM